MLEILTPIGETTGGVFFMNSAPNETSSAEDGEQEDLLTQEPTEQANPGGEVPLQGVIPQEPLVTGE